MYKIKDKQQFSELIGQQLMDISIASNSIVFRFDDDISISSQCLVKQLRQNRNIIIYENHWEMESYLTFLLGSSINEISVKDHIELHLFFSNGDTIILIDDSEEYESFQVNIGDKLIVV